MIVSLSSMMPPATATVCSLTAVVLQFVTGTNVKAFKIGASRLGLFYPTKVQSDDWAIVIDSWDEVRLKNRLSVEGYSHIVVESSSEGYDVVVCTRGTDKHVLILISGHARRLFDSYRRTWSRYIHECCLIVTQAGKDDPVFPPAPRIIFEAETLTE